MSTALVSIVRRSGMEAVPCLPTPIPGLVLAVVDDGVTVTHVRSGMLVAAFEHAEQAALFILHEVSGWGVDWTRSAGEIFEDGSGLKGLRDEAIARHGGFLGFSVDRTHERYNA